MTVNRRYSAGGMEKAARLYCCSGHSPKGVAELTGVPLTTLKPWSGKNESFRVCIPKPGLGNEQFAFKSGCSIRPCARPFLTPTRGYATPPDGSRIFFNANWYETQADTGELEEGNARAGKDGCP